MDLVSLVIWLLVAVAVFGLVFWALGQMSLPRPVYVIAVVVAAIILILFLLRALGMV